MDAVEGIDKPSKLIASKPRKRFVGASAKASASKTPIRRVANQVPDDILHDANLNEAMKGGYRFKIHVYDSKRCIVSSY